MFGKFTDTINKLISIVSSLLVVYLIFQITMYIQAAQQALTVLNASHH